VADQAHPTKAKAAAGVDSVDSRMIAGSVNPNGRILHPDPDLSLSIHPASVLMRVRVEYRPSVWE
jgi:hypothetical protein